MCHFIIACYRYCLFSSSDCDFLWSRNYCIFMSLVSMTGPCACRIKCLVSIYKNRNEFKEQSIKLGSITKKIDESPEEASPCSASLKKKNSSCCRKGIKSNQILLACCLFIIKALSCWEKATHTITLRAIERASCIWGREKRKNNCYSRRGARMWTGPRIAPRGGAGALRRPQRWGPETESLCKAEA